MQHSTLALHYQFSRQSQFCNLHNGKLHFHDFHCQPTNHLQSSADTGLPTGWEIRISNSKHLPYYFNPATKESRWEPPENADTTKLKDYMAANFTGSSSRVADQTAKAGNGSAAGQKIRAAHLLIKHKDSRRPASWREANITRTKEDARTILEAHEKEITEGRATLGDLAVSESDCSSARARGDL
jgi:NIMA-interacting peptidyl-prolyl cis-trans isomerase 1